MGNKKDMMKKIKSALVSVSDKSNLKPLLQILKKNKVKIISSGGTFKTIKRLSLNLNSNKSTYHQRNLRFLLHFLHMRNLKSTT